MQLNAHFETTVVIDYSAQFDSDQQKIDDSRKMNYVGLGLTEISGDVDADRYLDENNEPTIEGMKVMGDMMVYALKINFANLKEAGFLYTDRDIYKMLEFLFLEIGLKKEDAKFAKE